MNRGMQFHLRRAFSLTELLIVIAIAIIIIAISAPAFNFITGSKSVESAQNQISAYLSVARSEAVARGHPVGVFFFEVSGVSTLAIVESVGIPTWPSWASGVSYTAGAYVLDRRYCYICKTDHVSSGGNEPANGATTVNWVPTDNATVELVLSDPISQSSITTAKYEVLRLPKGIGVELTSDAQAGNYIDRYLGSGVILFNSSGGVDSRPAYVSAYGRLGSLMGLSNLDYPTQTQTTAGALGSATYAAGTGNNAGAFSNSTLLSSLALVLYDRASFNSIGGTFADFSVGYPNLAQPTSANEVSEEAWLDQNALLLTVNRINGTLVRSE